MLTSCGFVRNLKVADMLLTRERRNNLDRKLKGFTVLVLLLANIFHQTLHVVNFVLSAYCQFRLIRMRLIDIQCFLLAYCRSQLQRERFGLYLHNMSKAHLRDQKPCRRDYFYY